MQECIVTVMVTKEELNILITYFGSIEGYNEDRLNYFKGIRKAVYADETE